MIIRYWEAHDNVQWFGWPPYYFGSTVEATLPYAGVWFFLPQIYDTVVYQQDNTEALLSGSVRMFIANPTGVAAVAALAQERSNARFVFSRVFGRVN